MTAPDATSMFRNGASLAPTIWLYAWFSKMTKTMCVNRGMPGVLRVGVDVGPTTPPVLVVAVGGADVDARAAGERDCPLPPLPQAAASSIMAAETSTIR